MERLRYVLPRLRGHGHGLARRVLLVEGPVRADLANAFLLTSKDSLPLLSVASAMVLIFS
jgi:hypothetical protein